MEAEEGREPIILHLVPLLPELQLKALIIDSLPELKLTPAHIRLTRKDDKFQAYLMVPANKVAELCSLKEFNLGKQKVFIRKCFSNFHVFVSKLPDGLYVQDVHAGIEAQFGKVLKVEDELPHEGAKSKMRHCYIRFLREQDAEKCIFSSKKILVKGSELKVARAYAIGENEDTDKKLFLKVISPIQDLQELERTLNDTFSKEGRLRERIRVDSGIAVPTFTSAEVADRVLFQFKGNKIGKYDVLVRPFATNRDNFTIFIGGLVNTITQAQLEQALSSYQPLLSCSITPSNNPLLRNGSATFGAEKTFKRILAEYRDDPQLKPIFIGTPYITVHMSSKDRSEYNSYKKGKMEPQVKKIGMMPIGMPMGLPMGQMGAPMMFQQHQMPMPMGYGGMNRSPYGLPPQQYN